jgi:hypothetical protein
MRTLVIALMIALLPLRGWVGDAMAAQTALPVLQAHTHTDASHVDCPLHGASAEAQIASDDGTDSTAGCVACQICHTVAMEAAPLRLAVLSLPRAVLASASSTFASAERALSVKPPIV